MLTGFKPVAQQYPENQARLEFNDPDVRYVVVQQMIGEPGTPVVTASANPIDSRA